LPPTNYKTVFKADYKPRLGFYSSIYSIASELPDYPDWLTTGLIVTLQNLEDWCSFSLSHNSFMYIREIQKDNPKHGDEKRIHAILDTVVPKLEIETYQRFGLRCWYLSSVTMKFEELAELVSERFLVDNKDIRQGICPSPIDVAYAVHFMDNKFRVQLRVGPLKRIEMEQQFMPNRNTNIPVNKRFLPPEELFSGLPEVSLLMDIDVSKTDVKSKEMPEAYVQAQVIQQKLSQNIPRYVFGLKE
jgi:hypothetical protein